MNDTKRVKVRRKAASIGDADFDLALRQHVEGAVREAMQTVTDELTMVNTPMLGRITLQAYVERTNSDISELQYQVGQLTYVIVGIKSAITRYHASSGPLSEGVTVLLDDLNGLLADVKDVIEPHEYVSLTENIMHSDSLIQGVQQFCADTRTHAYETLPVVVESDDVLDDEMLDEIRRYRQRDT